MSPLPGWRLVGLLYGRFWCRSSLEVLRQWRAGMWSRAMWRGQPSHQPIIGDTAFYMPRATSPRRPVPKCQRSPQ